MFLVGFLEGGAIVMKVVLSGQKHQAAIAQLGERQTEDLKVPGLIPGLGILSHVFFGTLLV